MMIRLTWALYLTVFAASAAFATPRPVTLSTASSTFVSYVAGPETSGECVILVHDWFGVSTAYKDAVARLAQQGYCVVAVDLYDGRTATTHDGAKALLGGLDSNAAAEKIDAAIRSLSGRPRKIAVMGFSMGARHALAAAQRNPSVRATVLWYGGTTRDADQLRGLAAPVLLIVGSRDGSALEDSLAFAHTADAAGVGLELYIYPGAAHAFAQPLFNGGRTYDPIAAEAAWTLTEDFLRRRLH